MVAGILVGHGELPQAIHKTVQSFIGAQEHFQVISNENCSAQVLKKRIERAIENSGCPDTVIFVDLFGGSCANISKQILIDTIKKDGKANNLSILCGVNIAILIKFFECRNKLNFQELIELLEKTGKNEIRVL